MKPDTVRADRAKLIRDLRDICERPKITVDDAVVLKLLDLCQRSLAHLELPQKAAMQVIIEALRAGSEILNKEVDCSGEKQVTNVGIAMQEVAQFLEGRQKANG